MSLYKRGRLVKKFSFPLPGEEEEEEEEEAAGGEEEKKKGGRKPRRNFNNFNAVGLVYQVGFWIFFLRTLYKQFFLTKIFVFFPKKADEVRRCLKKGLTESSSMPLDESLAVAQIVEEISKQVGVNYEEVAKKAEEED